MHAFGSRTVSLGEAAPRRSFYTIPRGAAPARAGGHWLAAGAHPRERVGCPCGVPELCLRFHGSYCEVIGRSGYYIPVSLVG